MSSIASPGRPRRSILNGLSLALRTRLAGVRRGAAVTYGGDAYTGIQNTAVDTEIAVREAANAANALAVVIAERKARRMPTVGPTLWNGLAALIIMLGFVNFVSALHRFAAVRAVLA